MNRKWLGGLLILGLSAPLAAADVLDDLGVTEAQFAEGLVFPTMGAFPPNLRTVTGLEISEAHAAGVEARLLERKATAALLRFYENRGDFAKALEKGPMTQLEKVRLLSRSGRMDEARPALGGEEFKRLADHLNPGALLRTECRPLEEAQAWDELRTFLRLLSERLTSPLWKTALWGEELDIAWHLDGLRALLDDAAGDPLRLAFFHQRLGNLEERDRRADGLLENAPFDRLVEILGVLPDCPKVRNAGLALWNRADLTNEGRLALLAQLILLKDRQDFEETLRAWVANGGDAKPLANLIWLRWSMNQVETPGRAAVLAALVQRHPDEPRFQALLGRQVMTSDPARAADLFEKVAALPLTPAVEIRSFKWPSDNVGSMTDEIMEDLPFFAIRGLGLLDRQDRVQAVLDRQAGFAKLPAVDQVRYLAAGRMDYALVRVVAGSDFSKKENDVLAAWLAVVLETRVSGRVLPREVVGEIAAKFDIMAAGSGEKPVNQVIADSMALLRVVGKEELEVDVWRESLRRLADIVGKRDATQVETLEDRLRQAVADKPRLKKLFSGDDKPRTPVTRGDLEKGMKAWRTLEIFPIPEMRRIRPVDSRDVMVRPVFMGQLRGRQVPLHLLTRWTAGLGYGGLDFLTFGGGEKKEKQAVLQSLMRYFGAENPRRLLAEILVAKGLLECDDEVLKKESQESLAAVMAGKKEARGTEAFRYTILLGEGAGEDALAKVRDEVKAQPMMVGEQFFRDLRSMEGMGGSFPPGMNRQIAGLAPPIPPSAAAKKPDEDGVKLRELENRSLLGSPEAVELARRLLDKDLVRAEDALDYSAIQTAVRVLQITDSMDVWMKDAPGKLAAAGIPEVEALRRLQKIDGLIKGSGRGSQLEYDRKILALNPMDKDAARRLIGVAATEGNRGLLMSCLRALGEEGLSQLAQDRVLGAFGKDDAKELFSYLQTQNVSERMPGEHAIALFHGRFLAVDPELAAEFRSWLASRGNTLAACRLSIAGQLIDAGLKAEAVDILARAFVVPPEYPGFPYQFAPRAGTAVSRIGSSFDPKDLEKDIGFLRERQLFAPVVARIEELGSPDVEALVTFRLAATPDAATFDQHAMPLLEKKGEPYRGAMINQWTELYEKQPGTGSLLLRLLEERANGAKDQDLSRIRNVIETAAKYPGGDRLIAKQWKRQNEKLATLGDEVKKEAAAESMRRVLRDMLVTADNDTWRGYWNWRNADDQRLGSMSYLPMGGAPTGFVDSSRLRQILPRVISEIDGGMLAPTADGWALAAVGAGDRDLLGKVREALPKDAALASDICDLGLGETMKVSPVLGGAPEGNGEALLWWNFVVVPPADRERGGSDIPRCPFPALDGKFEIQITAGSEPNRQVVVKRLPAAAAAGHIRLKLADDQRYVAMLATEASTGVVRWTKPLDLAASSGLPLPVTDESLAKLGFERLAWNGPGDLPAWKIRFSGQQRVDLLERPWNGEPVSVGAWVSGEGKLELRCLDANGKDLEPLDLAAWDSPLPAWQFRSIRTPEKIKIPPETVRLVLAASVYGYNDGPLDFAISNVRMDIGPLTALPEGFERILRLPGASTSLAISPDAKRAVVRMKSGKLVVADLATSALLDIPRIAASAENPGRGSQIFCGPSWIYTLEGNGSLYRVDEPNRKLEKVISLRDGDSWFDPKNTAITADGKWIVWRDSNSHLMLASLDGAVRREITSARTNSFKMMDDGLRFMDGDGKMRFLKAVDFAAGDPMEDASDSTLFREELHPAWKGRLKFKSEGGGSDDSESAYLPVSREAVSIAGDGTLCYVDDSGTLILAKP